MQIFSRPQAEAKTGTLHVALLDGAGVALLHEELPAADAPHRRYMLCLQAELDVRDKAEDRKVYMGADWPPPEAGA